MGTYADSLLTQGEVVLRRERQHWLSLILETRLSLLLWVIAILFLLAVVVGKLHGLASDGLSLGSIVLILVGLAFFGCSRSRASSTSDPLTPTWRRSTTRSWRRTSSAGCSTMATWTS
jgi:hypothetical protein